MGDKRKIELTPFTPSFFGFPYPLSARSQEQAKQYGKDLFFNNKWPKQIHPLHWLIENFWPVPGWDEKQLNQLKVGKL